MAFLRRRDYYLMFGIGLFPIVFFVGMDFLYAGTTDRPLAEGVYSLAYSLIITAGLYVINTLIVRWLQQNHPWQNGAVKRILLEAVLCGVFSALWQAFVIYLSLQFVLSTSDDRAHYINNITFGLAVTFFVLLIVEGSYFFRLWRDSLTRVQRMEKQQLQAQLDQLKAQVQPHFLFNSLNTLSALLEVHQDIPRAVKFIDEFSLLYRRILEKKDAQLITLQEELRFVEAYLSLQRERFPNSLQVNIHVKESDMDLLILPMAIQELLENAIKHNKMSKSEPLIIEVYTQMQYLYITNPNRPKAAAIHSTGTGLKNLDHRLVLLGAPPSTIIDGKIFMVSIPLLKSSEEELSSNEFEKESDHESVDT